MIVHLIIGVGSLQLPRQTLCQRLESGLFKGLNLERQVELSILLLEIASRDVVVS